VLGEDHQDTMDCSAISPSWAGTLQDAGDQNSAERVFRDVPWTKSGSAVKGAQCAARGHEVLLTTVRNNTPSAATASTRGVVARE
jgi:hypothetical protein